MDSTEFDWFLAGFCSIVHARKRSMFNYIAKNFNSTFLFYLNKSNTCKEHSYLIMVYLSKESCPFPCMVLELFWCFVAFLAWFWSTASTRSLKPYFINKESKYVDEYILILFIVVMPLRYWLKFNSMIRVTKLTQENVYLP